MPPLPPRHSRTLVVLLLGLALALAGLATVLILRGWSDKELQEELREVRRERGLRI
jgi:hypothetical protein